MIMKRLILHRPITLWLVATLFYGCGHIDPEPPPNPPPCQGNKCPPVRENITHYTDHLKCLGTQIKEEERFKVTAAVGDIIDKTGLADWTGRKLTQGTRDMAIVALKKINAINIIEKENPNNPKSQFYLAGAITEYHEEIGRSNGGLDIFKKFLDIGFYGTDNFSGTDKKYTVAMDFRLASPKTHTVIKDSKGRQLAVSLKNEINVKEYNGVIFRVLGANIDKGGGANFGFRISDPKDLAIREIIENAIFSLIGRLFDVPLENCDLIGFEDNPIGGSVADKMTQTDQIYVQQTLEMIPTKESINWDSSDTQYTMLSTKTFKKEDGTPCREYYISARMNNRKEGSKGTACRQSNGVWKDI